MKQLRINRVREQARSHESNELAEISSVLAPTKLTGRKTNISAKLIFMN